MSLFDQLSLEKKFTGPLIHRFQEKYGEVFFRSLELLQNQGTKIKKHTFSPSNLEIWTIKGTSGRYLIYPEIYCQCHHFLIDIIYRKHQFTYCKHLFAQKLALCLGQYTEELLPDKEYMKWIKNFYH